MSKDLRQFLGVVRELGADYYVEAKKSLKPRLEVGILQQKLSREKRSPVIYCPEIAGSKLPLVTDLFGSYEMLGLALDLDPKEIDKAKILQEYKRRELDIKPPQVVPASEAPVKEVVLLGEDVNLGLLPILHHHELDSGKYITIGSMICKDPDTGIVNAGVYRHEVKGKSGLGCRIAPPHHAAYIARAYAELGKPMEVVISLGHHPAVIIGSLSPGSLDRSELDVIGGLLGEPLQVTSAETVDLPVPAFAEIAIEGVIDPRNIISDGPFGEFTRYYGEVMEKSIFLIQVTGITMRKDAIYHDLDPAHLEHNLAGALGLESIFYDAVKRVVPTVKAVHCPASGNCLFHVYVSIKKRIQGEGKFAGLAALGAEAEAKLVVIVDEDIDIFNEEEVLWAIATRVVADRDISIIPRVTGSQLDPTSYDESRHNRGHMSSKVIIDATRPVDSPFSTRITPNQELWNTMNLNDYLK